MEKIVIKFKHGRVIVQGHASNRHTWLASQKLNLNEVEPTRWMKIKRFVKKFIRCCKYALTPEVEVRPVPDSADDLIPNVIKEIIYADECKRNNYTV